MARRGELRPDAGQGLAQVRWRLARVEDGAELLELLTDHEAAVRALDSRLTLFAGGPTG